MTFDNTKYTAEQIKELKKRLKDLDKPKKINLDKRAIELQKVYVKITEDKIKEIENALVLEEKYNTLYSKGFDFLLENNLTGILNNMRRDVELSQSKLIKFFEVSNFEVIKSIYREKRNI